MRWVTSIGLLLVGCMLDEPNLELLEGAEEDPTGEIRRARMNIRVTVVGQTPSDMTASVLADHVAADCLTGFGTTPPFNQCAATDTMPSGFSAWTCNQSVCAMHLALCVSSRLLEASSTVDDMEVKNGQTTLHIHPQNNDGQTALAEEAFKYARWATVVAGENLRSAAGRTTSIGKCTGALTATVGTGGPTYAESIPMVLAEGTYIAKEAGYRANEGNMAAADAEFSLTADTGRAADLAWGAGVLSRSRGGHVLLGGNWDAGITEERFQSDAVAATPESPCVAIDDLTRPDFKRALDVLVEAGSYPTDVFNVGGLSAQQIIEGTGLSEPCGGMAQPPCGVARRLAVMHNREAGSLDPLPLTYDAFLDSFNISAADFNAARHFMAQQARAFDRSPTQTLPARPLVDDPMGMPRTEPTRYAATGSDASPMPDEYYRTFVTDGTDTLNHGPTFSGTASVVPGPNYAFDAKFTDAPTGEEAQGGVVQLVDYATSVAYDTSASTTMEIPTVLPLNTREALGTFLADAVRERRGRLESCYRLNGAQHTLRVRVLGFSDHTVIKAVEDSAGVSCAVHGHIDGAPCNVTPVGTSAAGTPFTHGQLGFRDYVEVTISPTANGKRYHIVRQLPGSHGGPGSFESLGSIQPVLSGTSTTNWAWCHLDPIVDDVDRTAAAALAPSPTVCTTPELPCTSLRNARLPLEDELTDDGDQYETSWRHYLNLAESAANHADQLGEDLIEAGQAIDERIEDATEGLEEICGGPIDLQGIIRDSFSSPSSAIAGSCSGIDGTPCGTAGYVCISRQCVRDALRVAEATADSNPTAERLRDCLSDESMIDYVALGDQPVCVWRKTSNPADICDPDALATGTTHACPYRPSFGSCTSPGPSLVAGYTTHPVTQTLNIFARDADTPGPTPSPPCNQLRVARDRDNARSVREDAAEDIINSGVFEFSNLRSIAETLGYEGNIFGYGAVTLHGQPHWSLGDPFVSPAKTAVPGMPGVYEWPCGPAGVSPAGCGAGEPNANELGDILFCSHTDHCNTTSGPGRDERMQMSLRLLRAIRALRMTTDVDTARIVQPWTQFPVIRLEGGTRVWTMPAPDLRRVFEGGRVTWEGTAEVAGMTGLFRGEIGATRAFCLDVGYSDYWVWSEPSPGPGTLNSDCNPSTTDKSILAFVEYRRTRGFHSLLYGEETWRGMDGVADPTGDRGVSSFTGTVRRALLGTDDEDAVAITVNPRSLEMSSHMTRAGPITNRMLLDAAELVCEASYVQGCPADLASPPDADDITDLNAVSGYLSCVAAQIESRAALEVLTDVPRQVLDAASRPSGLQGSRGGAEGRIAAAIIGLRTHPRALAAEIRGLASDMESLRLAASRGDLRRDMADLELWTTVSTQLTSCIGNLASSAAATAAGGVGAVGMIGSLVGCANAVTSIAAAYESNQLTHEDIRLEGEMDMAQFRERFQERVRHLHDLSDALQQTATDLRAALAELETARQRGQRLLGYANMMGGDAGTRHFAVNTAMRRRYNTLRRRYENARTYAVRMAHLARLAVEQRIGIPLNRLSEPMSLVEAPSAWADKLCASSGIDYGRIRDESELVVEGDHYADAYIGDYVRRLGQVVESYRLDFPFQNSQDTAIISMRDDIIRARAWCDAPVGNRLAFAGELNAQLETETLEPVWEQLRCTPMVDGTIRNCIGVSPLPATEAAERPVAAYHPELSTVEGYLVTFRPDAGESYNTGVALGQTLTLEAGSYLLSWYGKDVSGSPLSFPSAVKLQNPDGSAIAVSAVTTFPTTAAEWGRRYVHFTLPAAQAVVVAIVPATGVTTTHSVKLAAVMLEPAADPVPTTSGGESCMTIPECPTHAPCVSSRCVPLPREFAATSQAGLSTLPVCEDTLGTAFRGRWRKGCERVCPEGIGGACTEGAERCYWETRFNLSLEAIERGRLFSHAGFAYGNYNYRFDSIALNFVGSATRICDDEARPDTCYASAFVPYSITHNGPFWVRNHWGEEYDAPLFVGNIEHGRGLAMERYVTNPISSADRALLADYYHREFRGRPLAGDYTIRIWEGEGVNIEGIEDIQIVLDYRYWTRFE